MGRYGKWERVVVSPRLVIPEEATMPTRIERRDLVLLLGGAVILARTPRARQKPMPVIGFLYGASADKSAAYFTMFRNRLAAMGYVERQSVAIGYRYAEGITISCQGSLPNWFSAWRLASRLSSQPRRQPQPFQLYSSRVPTPSALASSPASTDLAAT
jgi:hypothetical protein